MDLNRDELIWIKNALNEVTGGQRAIPDWEFSMLMGGTRKQVEALLEKVLDVMSDQTGI